MLLDRPQVYIVLLLSALIPFPALAAAWLKEPGKTEAIVTGTYYQSDRFYDEDGNKQRVGEFHKYEMKPYAEYGWDANTTVGGSASLQYLRQGSNDNPGLADFDLFVRRALSQGEGWIVSWQPLLAFRNPFSDTELPPFGPTQMDAELRLLSGYGFSAFGQSHFVNGEVAYRKRFGTPGDEVRADFTLGVRPTEKLLVLSQLFTIYALDRSVQSNRGVANTSDYDLANLQVTGVLAIQENLSVQLGGSSNLHSRNTGFGEGVILGFWASF